MSRRARMLAGVVTAVTLGGTALAGPPLATAATGEPVITLETPDRVRGWSDGDRAWVELGLNAVTGSQELEIRSNRSGYAQEITTSWTSGDRSGTLPVGTQKNFHELPGFVVVKVKTLAGDVVASRRVGACLNSWGGARVHPEGAPTNPYPFGCPYNPYTLGSVQGIPAGWATPVLGEEGGIRLNLGGGTYDLAVRVRSVYAGSLGIPRNQRLHTVRLTVEEYSEEEFRRRVQRRTEAPESGDTGSPATEPTSERSGTVDGPRPDLRSLPAFGMEVNRASTQLRFGANVWNAGDSPLVVDGFRRDGEDVMDAYQYFFDGETQVGYQQVGEMHFHEGNHHHWHFEDFARYRLLDADKQPVSRSKKVSFCLANTDAVDYTVPGADWHPEGTELSTACGGSSSLSVREVLSSGSGDTYYQYRRGQALPIKDLPNGVYHVSVEANPFGKLVEADLTNNVSLRRIRLTGTPEHRRVKMAPVGLVEEQMWWY